MADTNALTTSDEMDFWALHMPQMRPMGYRPPPEPAPQPEPPQPDLAAEMTFEEFAQSRERLGIPDRGDIVGIRPWRRPQPTNE